jgi:hypothetical protein
MRFGPDGIERALANASFLSGALWAPAQHARRPPPKRDIGELKIDLLFDEALNVALEIDPCESKKPRNEKRTG